jgi:hypothetical protein
LVNERIQTIAWAKGETVALSVCLVAALEEESAILSVKERGFVPHKFNKGSEIAGRATGNCGIMVNESGRGFGFANRELDRGMTRHGPGAGADVRKGTEITTHVVTKAAGTGIICYARGERGHMKRMCRKKGGNTVKRYNSEN